MAEHKISIEELANLYDGTKVDLEVIEQGDNNGAYNLVKDEIADFISVQGVKSSQSSVGFYESLPNTELRKNIENVLKNKNLKEVILKRNAQQEFDAKMARIKKIKSKAYRKIKRKEKLKKMELLEEEIDSNSETETSNEDGSGTSASENIDDFNPVLEFNNKDEDVESKSESESACVSEGNHLFDVPGFKGNEIDFLDEKNHVALEDAPQIVEHSLPGWNSWAGEGLEFEKTKFNTFVEKKSGIESANRQDFRKGNVIINEHIETDEKFKSTRPYGYTGRDYNEKINTSISLETNSLKIFNRFVKMNNKDKHTPGQTIKPREFDPQY